MAEGSPSSLSTNDQSSRQVIYRADYKPSAFLIESTALVFDLNTSSTRVTSTLLVKRNPQATAESKLVLDGCELSLISVAINGLKLDGDRYQADSESLSVDVDQDAFELEIITEIDPSSNLALEGLYASDGSFCTQCEAEGFRRITYYLDRPDVLSVFTTKIIADRAAFPVLLSNGNKVASGDLEDGRHWVEWHDPFKKPCYLFALVAGKLEYVQDSFTTVSGRDVTLQIYAEAKDLDKCEHAMMSLKNAMRWDEDVYGREYDLDLYMIVAVDFFNMGAMENKGLNIFNTSCVLAHQATQTDAAFQRVEAVIAHEYFHNWSGNRVTCRDWFQLSLKEGFTVFRDACFSADMNSATVKRIEDVNLLRSAQFAEDAGPLAHPIRPDSFIEISNFYTLTIYEKGAEVIRMMHRLLGADAFRKGGDLYFERHDGEAATCEDFIVAMEEASGVDLQQFRRWYEQAGTPRIAVSSEWNADAGEYSLTFEQSCPSTPGQADKPDFCIPIDIALLHDNGTDDNEKDIQLEQELLVLTDSRTTIKRSGFNHEPVAALLRGFSAPVNLDYDYSDDQLLYLVRYETDGFVRWDATRRFFVNLIKAHLAGNQLLESELVKQKIAEVGELLVALIESGFESGEGDAWRPSVDAALLAEMLDPPGYTFVEQQVNTVDPIALSTTIDQLRMQYASVIHEQLASFYQRLVAILAESGGYQPTAGDIALRSLKNTCLGLTAIQPTQTELDTINDQYASADNMTDQFAALKVLLASESTDAHKLADDLLDQFYGQWQGESLVVNQWLGARVSANLPSSLARLKALQQHGAYDETNPNKVRALIGGFCANSPAAFHAHSGEGYGLLAQEVLRLDSANPQLAARLLTPLTRWQRFTEPNRGLMRAELQRIADSGQLSSDVFEVVSKSLAR